ncbi:hypothetical protein MA16_Dca023951 [Dendrobium catenatum]|uniref:Uncharacterized protein n=1 Tax=Dendrobium catenatum TaxID=906689 RepID=A0A2I0VJF3_9ASPA|nr:hypothetical protein MA16_Dca023951 [Dendrobium catenatum]
MARREDFGDCKFLDSGFISDEESHDSLFSSATDLMEDDVSSSSSSDHLLDLSLLMANLPINLRQVLIFAGEGYPNSSKENQSLSVVYLRLAALKTLPKRTTFIARGVSIAREMLKECT